jgi:cysteine-rich repeat protein
MGGGVMTKASVKIAACAALLCAGTALATLLCVGRAAALCGDGISEPGEQCDDGNAAAIDGCFGCCLEPGTITNNLPAEFLADDCFLNLLPTTSSSVTLLKNLSKFIQLTALAQSIDPTKDGGNGALRVCKFLKQALGVVGKIETNINSLVIKGSISGSEAVPILTPLVEATVWDAQIRKELLCAP